MPSQDRKYPTDQAAGSIAIEQGVYGLRLGFADCSTAPQARGVGDLRRCHVSTPIDRKEANFFFNLISELYERASLIITSNKDFAGWAELVGDDILTTAVLDRLLHHAHIYSTDGDSYRLPQNKTTAMEDQRSVSV